MFRLLFLLLTIALIAVVVRWGKGQERLAAFIFVAASLLSAGLQIDHVVRPDIATRVIDVVILGYLLKIALASDRFWPIWAAAFQSIAVLLHLLHLLTINVWFFVYANAGVFWSYPVYIAVIIGTLFESRFRKTR